MSFSRLRSRMTLGLLVFACSLALALPGCSYFQGAESDTDEEFAEFDKVDEPEKSDLESAESKPNEGELELKLKVGDRFPLKKRIEQKLTQGDGQGGMLVNVSLLEMLLSLEVEEIRDGNKRLLVRYHKVHYGHNIAGRKVEYNSEMNAAPPTEALVYAGLKDNGFSFWVGPDNRVMELVGFQEFLQRCLQNVPPTYRDAVLRQLEGTQNEEGLANFVDDGIGLLPYSDDPRHPAVAVKVGTMWELKPRRSEGPIPMSVSTRCVVKNLTETSAEIGLMGKINGSQAPVTIQDGSRYMRVMVKGGHCSGFCTVDRRTGLPTQSEVNRFLEMTVQLPDGSEIPQRKEILTSITSFLDQGGNRESTTAMQRTPDSNQFTRTSSFGQESGVNRVSQAVGTSIPADGPEERRTDARARFNQFDRSGQR